MCASQRLLLFMTVLHRVHTSCSRALYLKQKEVNKNKINSEQNNKVKFTKNDGRNMSSKHLRKKKKKRKKRRSTSVSSVVASITTTVSVTLTITRCLLLCIQSPYDVCIHLPDFKVRLWRQKQTERQDRKGGSCVSDNTDTGKSGISALPSFCRLCCAWVETRVASRAEVLFWTQAEAWPL